MLISEFYKFRSKFPAGAAPTCRKINTDILFTYFLVATFSPEMFKSVSGKTISSSGKPFVSSGSPPTKKGITEKRLSMNAKVVKPRKL
jgi:hypothetical protein